MARILDTTVVASTTLLLPMQDRTDYGKGPIAERNKQWGTPPKDRTKVLYTLADVVPPGVCWPTNISVPLGDGWSANGYQWEFSLGGSVRAGGVLAALKYNGVPLPPMRWGPRVLLQFSIFADPNYPATEVLSSLPITAPWFGLMLTAHRKLEVL